MLVIRLSRKGKIKHPAYNIVVAEKTSPVKGKFIEIIGYFDPTNKRFKINEERFNYWKSCGAKPSERIESILKRRKKGVFRAKKAKKAKKAKPAEKEVKKAPKASEEREGKEETKAEKTQKSLESKEAKSAGKPMEKPAEKPAEKQK